jgi:ectoine hydroxylase-related dioxygenase (phytanoyl-CoA dioxygenase family)
MDPGCLQYCMTAAQRDFFEQEGYLIVENALDAEMVGRLTAAGDRVDRRERRIRNLGTNGVLSKFRAIVEDDIFLELLDWPRTFPLIWDILGWNVQHYISHLIYYPPELDGGADRRRHWHQDGGRPVPEMERPHPRLSLKVAFWLTDIDVPDRGGIRIVPGSHKRDRPPDPDPQADPEGALQLQVKAGTAVLFDRRMWHARGTNTSEVTRKVLFLGYSYRWLRGLDYNLMPPEILAKCGPIRRQLLGDGVDLKGWWQPTDADVPLKAWLLEHKGEEYVERISEKQWEREKWA